MSTTTCENMHPSENFCHQLVVVESNEALLKAAERESTHRFGSEDRRNFGLGDGDCHFE